MGSDGLVLQRLLIPTLYGIQINRIWAVITALLYRVLIRLDLTDGSVEAINQDGCASQGASRDLL